MNGRLLLSLRLILRDDISYVGVESEHAFLLRSWDTAEGVLVAQNQSLERIFDF